MGVLSVGGRRGRVSGSSGGGVVKASRQGSSVEGGRGLSRWEAVSENNHALKWYPNEKVIERLLINIFRLEKISQILSF